MHELSIALSLIDAAAEKAAELGAVRVEAIHLKLGALSGVVREALLFSFDLAAAGTPIEGARLEIEDIPVAVFCQTCNTEQELPSIQRFRCPVCDTPTPDVVRGRELELAALEVTDLDEAPEEETHATEDR
jgi:hydrogenase nickel incorporation protein HypA/HybF